MNFCSTAPARPVLKMKKDVYKRQGEYDWLTLGKHSFYALWLAFLNLLHVNIVVGLSLIHI